MRKESLLQAEQQHATSTTNVSLNLVQLFKALGGWELTSPTEVAISDRL
jgi:outer membrane protein TolC